MRGSPRAICSKSNGFLDSFVIRQIGKVFRRLPREHFFGWELIDLMWRYGISVGF